MQRTILIVEDSDTCAATLEVALAALLEVAVIRAASGLDAVEILNRPEGELVRAVITDLGMPRMDGFELLEKIRSDPRHGRLPVIVMSGDPDPRNPQRVNQLGASAYFTKPFSPAQLRDKLEELLNGTS
jgi:CheY-like chemotaxis protein